MASAHRLPISEPRWRSTSLVGLAVVVVAVTAAGCSPSRSAAAESNHATPVSVDVVKPVYGPITRMLRVTGSLVADEQAEVSAEVVGRVVQTPVERGNRVSAGSVLAHLSAEQAEAQVTEADANAARIATGLGLGDGQAFDPERVPDVGNARAEAQLAAAEFDRIRSLLDQRVVSQSEFDQRRTRAEAARQHYEAERNKALQDYRSWQAANARVSMARKTLHDTVVRSPFAGLVVERFVSAGDFVGPGTKVATVVRVDPLRLLLTVPEQWVAHVVEGQRVVFAVDAFPGREFSATVRFISPALRVDQRALSVEAIVSNPDGTLKPGLFVTARIAQPPQDTLLVDARAVHDVGRTSRVFIVKGDRLEERIVTLGDRSGALVEVSSGLDREALVALPGNTPLSEGLQVRPVGGAHQ